MGLDVTAYRQLKAVRKLTPEEIEEGESVDGLITLRHFNDHYPLHAMGIPEDTAFTAEEKMEFRAGSYSGYNEWRNELAVLAGHPSAESAWKSGAKGRPFFELIHFSDCEGIINSQVSAKLAKDFADNQAKADAFEGEDADWFKEKYREWRDAFEMAADNGAVELH